PEAVDDHEGRTCLYGIEEIRQRLLHNFDIGGQTNAFQSLQLGIVRYGDLAVRRNVDAPDNGAHAFDAVGKQALEFGGDEAAGFGVEKYFAIANIQSWRFDLMHRGG